jgi:hypothetical protein
MSLANVFRVAGRFVCMEVPPLTSVEGAYWYLIALIGVLALLSTLYIVGIIAGSLPDPSGLF